MQSVDGDTAQVPPQLAEDLGIDQVAYAQDVHTEPVLTFRRIGAQGTEDVVPTRFPALVTVTACTDTLYRSFHSARAARNATIHTWSAADVGGRPRPGGHQGLADHRVPDLLPVRGPGEDLRDGQRPGRAASARSRRSTAWRAGVPRSTRRAPTRSTAASPPTTAASGSWPSARATASSRSRWSSWARPTSWPRSSASRSARSCPAPRPTPSRRS